MLTVPEAARLTGRDPETIRRWVRSGRLNARRDGPRLLLFREDVEAIIACERVPLPSSWSTTTAGGQPDWVALVRRSRGGAR